MSQAPFFDALCGLLRRASSSSQLNTGAMNRRLRTKCLAQPATKVPRSQVCPRWSETIPYLGHLRSPWNGDPMVQAGVTSRGFDHNLNST